MRKGNNIINILIIKLSAIGDVLLATPAFAKIRRNYSEARIHLLVGKWAAPIVQNNPDIDEIIEVDENIFWKKDLLRLFRLWWCLRKKNFSVIYVMHWSNWFNFFAATLGAKEIIGFDRSCRAKFLTRKVPFSEGDKGRHMTEKYLQMVDNLWGTSFPMRVYLTGEEIGMVSEMLKNILAEGQNKFLVVAPGGGRNPKSRMPIRCWPVEYFADLIQRIFREIKYPVILLGSSVEKYLGQFLESKITNKLLINLIGKTSLRVAAGIIRQAELLIANDSALLHLAAATGTKTISLFGPTAPYDKVPRGAGHIYYYKALECSPCYRYGKFPDCQSLRCLKEITPPEVFTAVERLLVGNR